MEKLLKYKPPRIAVLLMLVTILIYYFSPTNTILFIPYRLIGSIGIISGFTIMLWAWFQFKKSETAICPTAETTSLVTDGSYRVSRNPMYLGILLMLTGVAFFIGTVPAVLAPATFFIIMDRVFIPYEEQKLSNKFGESYTDYMKLTRRWL